jgi:Flp pilus assembly protein TadG
MLPTKARRGRKGNRRRGAELIEFTLSFMPFLAMILVLLDIAWAVFAKSTLTYAVRAGLRQGVTITATQATAAGNSNLVAMVKSTVQANALGLLAGSSGLSKIKVHFYLPPDADVNAAPTQVDAAADANKPMNIMQVSIEGYTLSPLVPRLFTWRQAVDNTSTAIAATSYDLIEPSRDVPPKGTAP